MNNLVRVNGSEVAILVSVDDDVSTVQFSFGTLTIRAGDAIITPADGEVPAHLQSISHDDVVNYTRASKKRTGPTKMERCTEVFLAEAGEKGINLMDGSVQPSVIKRAFQSEAECTEKHASSVYYTLKAKYEAEWDVSLSAPKKVKAAK